MLRFLVGLIAAIFLITFIRAIVGLIGKVFAQLFEPEQPEQRRSGASGSVPHAELKQCPGCGIYVSTETRLRKVVGGQTRYFCSEKCMKEYKG